jgi:hypothetical protein
VRACISIARSAGGGAVRSFWRISSPHLFAL